MTDTSSLEEIQTLKQRIADLERKEKASQRSERLLQAFNQASLAMSYATTPEEIFDTVAETLKGLGISSIIFSIDSDQEHLIVTSVTLDSQGLKAAEKIAGVRAVGLKVPIDPVDVLQAL